VCQDQQLGSSNQLSEFLEVGGASAEGGGERETTAHDLALSVQGPGAGMEHECTSRAPLATPVGLSDSPGHSQGSDLRESGEVVWGWARRTGCSRRFRQQQQGIPRGGRGEDQSENRPDMQKTKARCELQSGFPCRAGQPSASPLGRKDWSRSSHSGEIGALLLRSSQRCPLSPQCWAGADTVGRGGNAVGVLTGF